MKKIWIFFIVIYLLANPAFSQTTFSDETKKYIEYNDPVTVFKNALLIDGDPSKNISDIRKVQYVFKNGVGYNSKKLFDSVKGKVGFN